MKRMFIYFVKNKHGYVTVMLIAMLISVLFFNTTFLEIARYKSLEKLYGEIQENAAFSILANYDRDLFENFGLLAVEDDIDSEKLYEYIQADINQGDLATDGNHADSFFGGSEIEADLQKLYFLSQQSVFENQVNEFCAYRAPISMVNNAMDLESTLEELIKNLEDSIAGLNDFTKFMEGAGDMIEAFKDMVDYVKEIKENYLPAVESVSTAIQTFNEAVQNRDDFIAQIEAQKEANEAAIESGNYEAVVDTSEMEAMLPGIYDQVEAAAKDLQSDIVTMSEKTASYLKCWTEFKDGFKQMKEAKKNWTLENAKNDEDIGEMAQTMDETYEETSEEIQLILDKTEPYGEDFFETVGSEMEQTKEQLDGSGETMTKLSVDTSNPYNLKMDGYAESVQEEIDQNVKETEEELKKEESKEDGNSLTIADLIKIFRLLIEIMETGGTYNIECVENINGIELVDLTAVENAYALQDEAYVDRLLSDVEATLDIKVDTNEEYFGSQTMHELEACLNNLYESTRELQNTFGNFELSLDDFSSLLEELKGMLDTIINFFKAAMEAINALVSYAIEGLMRIIYEKTFAATYATEMFTNRSSSISDDTRLNGSEFKDYGVSTDHEVFVMANAEYVFAGTPSEETNQKLAFMSILGLRIFANIPTILVDKGLESLANLVAAIPYVGPVLSVVLYAAIIVAEAYLDMLFMIYGDEGVSIIKTKGYLNLEGKGIDELEAQLESVIEKLDLDGVDDDDGAPKTLKGKWKKTLSGAGEGLTKWNYKQHLFLVLCLFRSASYMYEKEAQLIQMQLDKEKDEEFRLSNMGTFVRTDTTVYYDPLLPVPYYGDGIAIRKLYYTGY